ncbi:PREDICTED: probable starch synthase 4, chloroplastic/amyloplastic isoform X2 [Lupinus angustifolius]|uniref:probable starch synthase 4, chloroplastic/amyloplastic isoform X2 n=1 Tax=Lupinus angustifolius TaxID=3871 RepID=UPI00092EB1CE|nr:PREDICTED: probable starch synthase 4, chloroplastic/amyloplastic isoform X2 [Lupinus angustifolius]
MMALKLKTCLVCWNLNLTSPFNCNNHHHHHNNAVLSFPTSTSHRLLHASCKMRHRPPRSQQKKQQIKKASKEQPSSPNQDDNSKVSLDTTPNLNKEILGSTHTENSNSGQHTNEEILIRKPLTDVIGNPHLNQNEDSKVSLDTIPHTKNSDSGQHINEENLIRKPLTDVIGNPHLNQNEDPKVTLDTIPHTENSDSVQHTDVKILNGPDVQAQVTPLGIYLNGAEQAEQLSGGQLENLLSLIRKAEKNILLLNQARVRAVEDLEKILAEKEALQGEINVLEMRLAESDSQIEVATQEKINMELLEDQLEKLRAELASRASTEELNSLKEENTSLKNAIDSFKTQLNDVKNTDKHLVKLEEERASFESALKEMESKLLMSQEDVSKLSTLRVECKDLSDKVENLQLLLDKATKHADQATTMLQQNQDLRRKVDQLEASLDEANMYKLSSDKLQKYNEQMQEKIKILESHLQKSDEEIYSYVQMYQESVEEFQDTLNTLKEESKRRELDEPVDDMPWDFWSGLLLLIDGWSLEKKISIDDAKLLREKVWKRDKRISDIYMACKKQSEHEAISAFLGLVASATSPGLYVIHIAAEMAPVAKVGGLGDVVSGLCKALQKKGHLAEIILPKYDCIQYDRIRDFRALDVVIESYFDGQSFKNKIYVGTIEGLPVYFIEPHHPDKFFWRGKFYGEHDDFRRFSYFSRAALEFLLQAGKKPDIIHCHDWQTAFVAPLYWDVYAPKGLNSARICFTCHNFEYQGTAPASHLESCGLDAHHLNRPDRMQDNSAHDRVNSVKGGVVFSNIVTTVSPTYAQEVRTAEGGHGLHSTLSTHSKKFLGILNGIDTDAWNPATDTFLEVQYNANDLQGKAQNKEALRRDLGLSSADVRRPLLGCITRLVPQKGVHLIRHAIYRTLELGGQFVLLGSSPVPHIQREFEGIANNFQNHDHARLILKYDESLSHVIYAASDMFIIPSIFEPCGLTQMISMRYGAIPIVRKTGGLNDSVFDVDDDTVPSQFQNGFTFLNADEPGINGALDRAFNLYMNNPEIWQQLVRKDMNMDFSWDTSAAQYEDIYSMSVARARATKK